ncbi:MAG: FAD binding domain-containing protein [Azospirillaceae bacterium]
MKPASFDYYRARDLDVATAVLAEHEGAARILAGGQSLVPMLNLRLAPVAMLVDVGDIAELRQGARDGDGVRIGACVTHAAIEDGAVPDATRGLLGRVAAGIAYRAIRTRGTIGGSLALADPAAEWPVTMLALDATVRVHGPHGKRDIAMRDMVLGAYTTAVEEAEIVESIAVPALSAGARHGVFKVCRKTGEYAASIGVAVSDREAGRHALALGGLTGGPARLGRVERRLSEIEAWSAETGEAIREAAVADLAERDDEMSEDERGLHAATAVRTVKDMIAP